MCLPINVVYNVVAVPVDNQVHEYFNGVMHLQLEKSMRVHWKVGSQSFKEFV